MYRRITLTTDLSQASHMAFMHALGLARLWRAALDILHVRRDKEEPNWQGFPQVRGTLQHWGIKNLPQAVGRNTSIDGLHINKVDLPAHDAAHSLAHYIKSHDCDLIVAASHGRLGIGKLARGSVTEEVLQATKLPALLLGPEARPFVDVDSGAIAIDRVVFPLAATPSPEDADYELSQFLPGPPAEVHYVHVHEASQPFDVQNFRGNAIVELTGSPASAIVSHAERCAADLIVMATAGSKGVKDRLFGSTTTQVVAHAPCPVLVVPS